MKQITILLAFLIGTNLLADVEKGKAVYAANCAICHTVTGGGAMGPDLNIVSYTRKKKEIEDYARDPYEFYEAFGYSANAMPTLPLEDQEFKDVADYIDSLQPFKKWMKKKKD
ncbi:MAG: cytochrome c [Sulfurovum sp.]|nr:MAG: cytochrome c [Sulfurovum sp.]